MWQKSDFFFPPPSSGFLRATDFSFSVCERQISLVSRISCHSSACHPQMSYYLCDICVQVMRRQDAQSSKLTVLFGLELLTESQWCPCLLVPFYVVMFLFRQKNLPVISGFDILHAPSFNHSSLRMTQSSTDFCSALNLLHWLSNNFLHRFKLCNSLDICLVVTLRRMSSILLKDKRTSRTQTCAVKWEIFHKTHLSVWIFCFTLLDFDKTDTDASTCLLLAYYCTENSFRQSVAAELFTDCLTPTEWLAALTLQLLSACWVTADLWYCFYEVYSVLSGL